MLQKDNWERCDTIKTLLMAAVQATAAESEHGCFNDSELPATTYFIPPAFPTELLNVTP